jgi:hypothetical protein
MMSAYSRALQYAVGSLVILSVCTPGESNSVALGTIETLASPAAAGSGEPNLSAGPDGRAYLSWIEPAADSSQALRFAALDGDRWSAPRTIAQRKDLFVNWADFPSVLPLDGRTVAAHWLQRSGTAKYAYDVRIAQSADGGDTWSTPVVPHRDATQTEHGFVSLFAFRDSLAVVWLDGRNFARVTKGEKADMMLVTTKLAANGATGDERVLDERVCDCCQTSWAVASSGPVVVYRDRLNGEVRDISLVRWSDSGWTQGSLVHADGWNIDFCPVNGPAVAAAGQRVAVAWFTGARDTSRVLLARSDDGGASFGPPVRVDDGKPVGRVDIELDDHGGALVSWMEFTSGQQADVRVRRVDADGALGRSVVVARSSGERASGFPRMVIAGGQLIFAWTESGERAGVRVARARLTGAR